MNCNILIQIFNYFYNMIETNIINEDNNYDKLIAMLIVKNNIYLFLIILKNSVYIKIK